LDFLYGSLNLLQYVLGHCQWNGGSISAEVPGYEEQLRRETADVVQPIKRNERNISKNLQQRKLGWNQVSIEIDDLGIHLS